MYIYIAREDSISLAIAAESSLPPNHPSQELGARIRPVLVRGRARRLLLPIPLPDSAREFTRACRILSGHAICGRFYSLFGSDVPETSCPCGVPAFTTAHILLECPLTPTWGSSTTGTSTGPQFETHGSLPGRGIPMSYAGFRVIRPPGFGMPMLYPTVDPERFAVAFIIARSIPNLSLDTFVQLVDERFPLIDDECNPYYLHLAYLDAVNCWECEGIRASEELGLRAWMLPEPDLFTS
ncbi:hypothetical protein BOTBODRAFT_179932 [Botryobasidium botryosum FD-172 SS1]|uniref:Uncharacterized protein n=1 Tax=Botryobasidium botryosum (strain FD-172 SS1) TaxID=930990 RepID=A0A067LY36_BOTB1|nr:hypothetical protein BOTBODRAFT_179932 [Botryobasidium botryosum FD-172 SS1]